jgi:hypothetical protein
MQRFKNETVYLTQQEYEDLQTLAPGVRYFVDGVEQLPPASLAAVRGAVGLAYNAMASVPTGSSGSDYKPFKVSKRFIMNRPTGLVSWSWTEPLDTRTIPSITQPLGRYYIYTATDHDTRGGIRLLYSDSKDGPWTLFSGGSDGASPTVIYEDVDDTAGRPASYSTETPKVMWDQKLGKLRMFYHCVNPSWGAGVNTLTNVTDPNGARDTCTAYVAGQGTMSSVQHASDTRGVIFTKDRDFSLDIPWTSAAYGVGNHTGYFNPFFVRGGWHAYHLLAGGDAGAMGVSHAIGNDLSKWRTEVTPLPRHAQALNDAGRTGEMMNWHSCIVLETAHGLMLLGRSAAPGSGTAIIPGALICAPIAEDLRALCGPITVLDAAYSQSWEANQLAVHIGWLRNDDGSLEGYFMYKDTMGAYHVN